jgi:hypothetical protein
MPQNVQKKQPFRQQSAWTIVISIHVVSQHAARHVVVSVIGSILKCFQSVRQHIIDTDILQISIDLLKRKSNTGHTKRVRGLLSLAGEGFLHDLKRVE